MFANHALCFATRAVCAKRGNFIAAQLRRQVQLTYLQRCFVGNDAINCVAHDVRAAGKPSPIAVSDEALDECCQYAREAACHDFANFGWNKCYRNPEFFGHESAPQLEK